MICFNKCVEYLSSLTFKYDMKKKKTITNEQQYSISQWTPFDGMDVIGWPISTIIRGCIVMQNDELSSMPIGKPVEFIETS